MSADGDRLWDTLEAAACRLTGLSTDTVTVRAFRRRRLMRVTEGLEAGDEWVYGITEPVRWRWPLSPQWHQVASIEAAASGIERFLRERPDQKGSDSAT